MGKRSEKTIPEFLCIGISCHDRMKSKYILGGTVSYAALAAEKMKKKSAILTSVGNDFQFHHLFKKENILFKNKKSKKTTVFHNIYKKNKRLQIIKYPAKKLKPGDLPASWSNSEIILLGPIANEVDAAFMKIFPNSLVGATIQGWLRKWDRKGKVGFKTMNWKILKHADVVFLSMEDIQYKRPYLKKIIKYVNIVAVTRGKAGATIFHKNKKMNFPAYPTLEVDPTGCGDLFAAAFLIKYADTKSIKKSASFANAAASLVVEHLGTKIPDLKKINKRYKSYKKIFSL